MLTITVKAREAWDAESETFEKLDRDWTLKLEHSLISISDWEAIHKKPYLDDSYQKTAEEILDYIKCMTITSNVDSRVYQCLTPQQLEAIQKYINEDATATTFTERNAVHKYGRGITSELIYYWMTAQNIPFECEKWHLSRLLTLIRIASIENDPKRNKKMGRKDIYNQNRALNAARRAKHNTRG